MINRILIVFLSLTKMICNIIKSNKIRSNHLGKIIMSLVTHRVSKDILIVLHNQTQSNKDSNLKLFNKNAFFLFSLIFSTFGNWEHQLFVNSGIFEVVISKFMIFSSAVFKDFKF